MRRWALLLAVVMIPWLGSCGSTPEKPAASPQAEGKARKQTKKKASKAKRQKSAKASSKPSRKQAAEAPSLFPKRCARKDEECLPPSEWVKKLCDDIYPDLALHLFGPNTPWKRLYMRARAEPFNASGGVSLVGD